MATSFLGVQRHDLILCVLIYDDALPEDTGTVSATGISAPPQEDFVGPEPMSPQQPPLPLAAHPWLSPEILGLSAALIGQP